MSSGQQDKDSAGGFNTEDGDRETQAGRKKMSFSFILLDSFLPSNGNNELFSLSFPVDSSHGPCDTNTKEHVDSIRASHVTNGVISSIIFNSGGLGSEGI